MDGFTPLGYATHEGHASVVDELLEARADTNIPNRKGNQTPVWCAACGGHTRVAVALLRARADHTIVGKKGSTDKKGYTH